MNGHIVYLLPQAAWLLVLAPIYFWLAWRQRCHRRKQQTLLYGTSGELPGSSFRSPLLEALTYFMQILAWIFIVLAFMQPTWQANTLLNLRKEAVKARPTDIIFILDASASMLVADTPPGLSRFDVAKDIVRETLPLLPGQQIGVKLLTSSLIPIVPATLDHFYLKMQLEQSTAQKGSSRLTDLPKQLQEYVKTLPLDKSLMAVLLSDGEHTSSDNLIISQEPTDRLHLYTVGIGSESGGIVPGIRYRGLPVKSALEENTLKRLAASNQGTYYKSADYALSALAEKLAQAVVSPVAMSDPISVPTIALWQIPLVIAILLLTVVWALPCNLRPWMEDTAC